MELGTWLTYFAATIVLSLSPGPGVFSSISSGMRHGFRLGVWNGIGMQFANLFIAIGVSLGLGALLLASETLFTLVKWLGVAYLIYLGVTTWRAPAKTFEEDKTDTGTTAREIFMHGFFVNATNPKGIIFFAAILPQFVDVAHPRSLADPPGESHHRRRLHRGGRGPRELAPHRIRSSLTIQRGDSK